MATYRGKNRHAEAMFDHYLSNFDVFLAQARHKIDALVRDLGSSDFFAEDFRVHAARAIAEGAGILCFAPTYAKGYERIYKFLNDNVEWERLDYEIWNPADLDEWVRGFDDAGARYCVLADRRLDGLEPSIRYDNNAGRKTIWGYADASGSSLRSRGLEALPFFVHAH
jgi:hypothetical protein